MSDPTPTLMIKLNYVISLNYYRCPMSVFVFVFHRQYQLLQNKTKTLNHPLKLTGPSPHHNTTQLGKMFQSPS
jgi:hypothetical protein